MTALVPTLPKDIRLKRIGAWKRFTLEASARAICAAAFDRFARGRTGRQLAKSWNCSYPPVREDCPSAERQWLSFLKPLGRFVSGYSDFWKVVGASESLDGYLFSLIEDRTPYGRRGLIEEHVAGVLARRTRKFGLGWQQSRSRARANVKSA